MLGSVGSIWIVLDFDVDLDETHDWMNDLVLFGIKHEDKDVVFDDTNEIFTWLGNKCWYKNQSLKLFSVTKTTNKTREFWITLQLNHSESFKACTFIRHLDARNTIHYIVAE